MTLKFGPNTGLLVNGDPGEGHFAELMHQWRWVDFFLNPTVSGILDTPPVDPGDGDAYIVGVAPTGEWDGFPNYIARWTIEAEVPNWEFQEPHPGYALVYDSDSDTRYVFDGTEWVPFSAGSGGGGSSSLRSRWTEFFLNPGVLSIVSGPPASPEDKDAYIVGLSATGVWAGQDNSIARWTTATEVPGWEFYVPLANTSLVYNYEDSLRYMFTGTEWAVFSSGSGGGSGGTGGGGSGDLYIVYPSSNVDIVAGPIPEYAPAARRGVLTGVVAFLRVPSSSGSVAIDVKKNNVSILSTAFFIENGSKTSLQSPTQPELSDDIVTAGDEFTASVITSGIGAQGLIIVLLFEALENGVTWRESVGNDTFRLSDVRNGVAVTSATPCYMEVPNASDVDFPPGCSILVTAEGLGVVNITAAAGVTIESRSHTRQLVGRFAVATLVNRATNRWNLLGDISL